MADAARKFETRDDFELPKKSGSGKEAKEHEMAAELGRNRNADRRQAQERAKNPNEADSVEIDALQARVNSTDGTRSSIRTSSNQQGGVNIYGTFDIDKENPETTRGRGRKISRSRKPSWARAHPQEELQAAHSDQESQVPSETDENDEDFEHFMQEMDREDPQNPYQPFSNEDNKAPDSLERPNQNSTEDGSEESKEELERQEEVLSDQEEEEELEKQQEEEKVLEQKQKQQEEQKKAQIQMIQQSKQLEEERKKQQKLWYAFAKATRKKQALDAKIRNLKMKKLALQIALHAAKLFKTFITILHSAVRWLASACMSIAWLIIPAIIGVILYIIYVLMFIPKTAAIATVKIIQAKIKSIEKDIEETEVNRKKLINVIQSIQRKKRTGSAKPVDKFPTPQQA